MATEESAVLAWLNSFPLRSQVVSLHDLSDGIVLQQILVEVSSDFTMDSLHFDTSNYVLKATNLKMILEMLQIYYRKCLNKIIDITTIDINAIAKDNDVDEILNYVELVLGAVVMCPNKAKFIENIFKLDSATQKILQVYIQRVMSSAIDVSTDTEVLNVDSASSGISEELIRAQEMIKHLSNERNRLLETIASVEGRYSALHDDHEELQVKCKELENDRNKYELERLRVSSSTPSTAVMMELDESKRSLDLLNVEHEKLKVENKKLIVNTNLSKELVAKLEQEKAQISDELDIARSKASQLSKVEATVEKYKSKLEELSDLKKQNKELTEKMDSYLDQIYELESSANNIPSLNKMMESYKDRCIELEREKFETISQLELQKHDIERLHNELEQALEAKKFLDEENTTISSKLEQLEAMCVQEGRLTLSSSGRYTFGGDTDVTHPVTDSFETETTTSLREKIYKLEKEIKLLKNNDITSVSSSSSNTSVTAANLQEELVVMTQLKQEREDNLLSCKKEIANLQQENNKLTKLINENEQKVSLQGTTVKMLEDKLKEKVSEVNNLEQQKLKLEVYTKRSLSTFRDKYMAALEKIRVTNSELSEKLAMMTSKQEKTSETVKREERLMLSAIYELGVRIMDKNIAEQSQSYSDI